MSVLLAIQEQCADRIRTDSLLEGVAVYTEKAADLGSQIEMALGGMGLCVAVLTPSAVVGDPILPGPHLNPAYVVVRVMENPRLNVGSRRAIEVAERVLVRLHQFKVDAAQRPLTAASLSPSDSAPEDAIHYDVAFHTICVLS